MPAPPYFRHPTSLAHLTGAHPERPARIEALERALAARDWCGFRPLEATAPDRAALEAVHPPEYLDALARLSERGGGQLDADTVMSAGSWEAAVRGAGGACAAVEELVGGQARVAFAGHRPPGHHAGPSRAMGFCLLNSIAVAARHAQRELGVGRVLVLDWDVHHGNGTNEIFHADPSVLFVSIHQSPLYPGTGPLGDAGSGDGEGFTINLPVPGGSGEDVWAGLVEHVVLPAAEAFGPGLVLVSAGYDAHIADPLGGCRLETESFARLTRTLRDFAERHAVPLGLVLEGGYDLEALSASVAATLDALLDGEDAAPPVEPGPLVKRLAASVGRYWPVTG